MIFYLTVNIYDDPVKMMNGEGDFTKALTDAYPDMSEDVLEKIIERTGKSRDLAIKLYEKNITENFDGSHPYNRLAIIYRKQKDYQNEIRVLNKAINVFSNLMPEGSRTDIEHESNNNNCLDESNNKTLTEKAEKKNNS